MDIATATATALSLSPSDMQGLSPTTMQQLAQLLEQKHDDRSIALYRESLVVNGTPP
jgi:hypothetical protein